MEHFFTCPYCWETISMILDESDEMPDYIEDCEVCCRPIEIKYRIVDHELLDFSATKMEGI
jgi:hypothetical protein